MRVFVAIEFEQAIKDGLKATQDKVRPLVQGGNFSRSLNFHITIRFLGEVDKQQIPTLNEALDEAAHELEPFSVEVTGIGHFPKGSRSVLWAGIKTSEPLQRLYEIVEQKLYDKGYPKEERKYNPHITLAREVKIERFQDVAKQVCFTPIEVPVQRISLMESTRIDGKLTYRPLHRVELKTV